MAVLDKRVVEQYKCNRCGLNNVLLYRKLFNRVPYCKSCCLLIFTGHKWLAIGESRAYLDRCIVPAIPSYYHEQMKGVKYVAYMDVTQEDVDKWSGSSDGEFHQVLRSWLQ
jgi:hypothetical protein